MKSHDDFIRLQVHATGGNVTTVITSRREAEAFVAEYRRLTETAENGLLRIEGKVNDVDQNAMSFVVDHEDITGLVLLEINRL